MWKWYHIFQLGIKEQTLKRFSCYDQYLSSSETEAQKISGFWGSPIHDLCLQFCIKTFLLAEVSNGEK